MATTVTDETDPGRGKPADQADTAPSISAIQADIALANNYRLELVKTVLTLAMALFAFTVSFPVGRDSTTPITGWWLGWVSWAALAVSILAGLVHVRLWEAFYISYRDHDWKQKKRGAGKTHRDKITRRRRIAMVCQYSAFVIGVITVGLLAALNIKY